MKESLKIKQMKWFGHFVRMAEDRKSWQIIETPTEGRYARGRLRNIYKDSTDETSANVRRE